jgi:RNA polymerase sigma-70 factor (ECF subfamily)
VTERPNLDSTEVILRRIRGGDERAREVLLARYLPILRRWAHGRLPAGARGLADTDDLVQVTLVRVLDHLDEFEPRHEGAFIAYVRRTLLNVMRNEIQRSARRRTGGEPPDDIADPRPSPLESAIGREVVERYETALAELAEEQQEAVIMRIEMGFTHHRIAEALGKPSADAARMTVSRALLRLADAMRAHDE